MSTNATCTKGDIQTKPVIPIEAADSNHTMSPAGTNTEVEILADVSATKSVVERKQGMMWDVSAVTGRYLSTDFVVSDAKDFDSIGPSDNKYLIDKVYMSSTSSIVIFDDVAILAIKALKKANSVVEQQNSATPTDLSQPRDGTLIRSDYTLKYI
ncbi:hypothetical protein Tco_0957899 [Tanacetum coccineum]